MVIGMAKACRNMSELKSRMAEQFGKDTLQLTFYLDPPGRDRASLS
jgi:predicted secreted protein